MTEVSAELSASLDLALVPQNAAEQTKGFGCLADSGVHLKRRAAVILYTASQVLEARHHLN